MIILIFHVVYIAGKCDYPNISRSVTVSGYGNDPTVHGSIINFTCPPGQLLTGPIMSTCMENGEWEPDPEQVHVACNGQGKSFVANFYQSYAPSASA